MRLYIIGNGFDLLHGLKTGFGNFKRYLRENSPELFVLFTKYIPGDGPDREDEWRDFETRLAHLSVDELLDDMQSFLPAYGDEEWSDSGHHDFEVEIERVLQSLTKDLRRHFEDWIECVRPVAPKSLEIDPGALFLSFNYTSTLEVIYQVAPSRILHLHGYIDDVYSEIVLGHGRNSPSNPPPKGVSRAADQRLIAGGRIISGYFAATFKNTNMVIASNRAWFDKLNSVTEVIVLGHSLGDIDLPYFQEVANCVTPDSKWTVSYFPSDDTVKRDMESRAAKLNLQCSFKLIEDIE
jgi:Bacteriophage abortive infection AbiH